jgi:hypothetical protein
VLSAAHLADQLPEAGGLAAEGLQALPASLLQIRFRRSSWGCGTCCSQGEPAVGAPS